MGLAGLFLGRGVWHYQEMSSWGEDLHVWASGLGCAWARVSGSLPLPLSLSLFTVSGLGFRRGVCVCVWVVCVCVCAGVCVCVCVCVCACLSRVVYYRGLNNYLYYLGGSLLYF